MSWEEINENLMDYQQMRAKQEAARSSTRAANELAALRAEQQRELALPQCIHCGGRIQPNFSICQHCRNPLGWVRGVACIPGTEEEVLALFIAEDKRQQLQNSQELVEFRENRLNQWWIATLFILVPIELFAIAGLFLSNPPFHPGWLIFCVGTTMGLLIYIFGWVGAIRVLQEAKQAHQDLVRQQREEAALIRKATANHSDTNSPLLMSNPAASQNHNSHGNRLDNANGNKCWMRRGTQVKGPVEKEQLIKMIKEQAKIEKGDLFAYSPNGPWLTYQEFFQLSTRTAKGEKPTVLASNATKITCPTCQKILTTSNSNIGKLIKCPSCNTKLKVT